MKRISLARRNALLEETRFSPGVAALLVALLLAAWRLLLPDSFSMFATQAARVGDVFSVSTERFFASFKDASRLDGENERLRGQNAELSAQLEMFRARLSPEEVEGTRAGVILRPPLSPYDTLLVGAGELRGVRESMEVFAESGPPVGVVSETRMEVSYVRLFSSPGVRTQGWVGEAKTPLTLAGAGGGTFKSMLAKTAPIAEGDLVYLPGPGALPMGRVAHVATTSEGLELHIEPLVNLFSLTSVILRGYLPHASGTLP